MEQRDEVIFSEVSLTCSPENFSKRAALKLHNKPPNLGIMMPKQLMDHSPSDFDLNPSYFIQNSDQRALIEASVLVPIIKHRELTVLLTKRTDHLPKHAGQISFPGGKNDPSDKDPVVTALREAEEEIGLNKVYVEPLGFLDTYHTVTGYSVTPVVAFLNAESSFFPNPDEVSELFEVPLAFLMDPNNLEVHSQNFMGQTRNFYAFSYKNYYIWGATAGILKNMYEKIFCT